MNKMTLHRIGEADEFNLGICNLASEGCNGAKNKRVFDNVCSTEMREKCRYYQNKKSVQNTEPDEITYSQLIFSGGQA